MAVLAVAVLWWWSVADVPECLSAAWGQALGVGGWAIHSWSSYRYQEDLGEDLGVGTKIIRVQGTSFSIIVQGTSFSLLVQGTVYQRESNSRDQCKFRIGSGAWISPDWPSGKENSAPHFGLEADCCCRLCCVEPLGSVPTIVVVVSGTIVVVSSASILVVCVFVALY